MKKNVSSPNLTQLIGNGSAGGNLGLGLDFDLDLANLTSQKADTRTSGTANQKMEAKPNYSRSLFEDKPEPQQKPNLNSVFGEFLNDVGFTATSNKLTNQTMNELRMETNAKELDPITIQVNIQGGVLVGAVYNCVYFTYSFFFRYANGQMMARNEKIFGLFSQHCIRSLGPAVLGRSIPCHK